jgi:hypothetical protein
MYEDIPLSWRGKAVLAAHDSAMRISGPAKRVEPSRQRRRGWGKEAPNRPTMARLLPLYSISPLGSFQAFIAKRKQIAIGNCSVLAAIPVYCEATLNASNLTLSA